MTEDWLVDIMPIFSKCLESAAEGKDYVSADMEKKQLSISDREALNV